MSHYIDVQLTVTGDAENLRDFVTYLEDEYEHENASSLGKGLKQWRLRNYCPVNYEYENDNCFSLWGCGNYLSLAISPFSSKFPSLKFEYIESSEDGCSGSSYEIWINKNCVDYEEVDNALTFNSSPLYEGHCKLCHARVNSIDWYCEKCHWILYAIDPL